PLGYIAHLPPDDPGLERRRPRRVVRVRVGEQDRLDPASGLRGGADAGKVGFIGRARVHHVGGVATDHVGVRPGERHRPRIRSDDPHDVGMARRDLDAAEYIQPPMADRWATFDCYGTLVDWEQGLRDALSALWPEADAR